LSKPSQSKNQAKKKHYHEDGQKKPVVPQQSS